MYAGTHLASLIVQVTLTLKPRTSLTDALGAIITALLGGNVLRVRATASHTAPTDLDLCAREATVGHAGFVEAGVFGEDGGAGVEGVGGLARGFGVEGGCLGRRRGIRGEGQCAFVCVGARASRATP